MAMLSAVFVRVSKASVVIDTEKSYKQVKVAPKAPISRIPSVEMLMSLRFEWGSGWPSLQVSGDEPW
jgi:hypothetical protein